MEQVYSASHSGSGCRYCAPRLDGYCGRAHQRHAHDQQKPQFPHDLDAGATQLCRRWTISVPSTGTVGIYRLTMKEGSWSKSLTLYVIFQLPAGKTDAFVDAFIYDDNSASTRDTSSIGYNEYDGTDYSLSEYTHSDFSWIPEGEWVNHGYIWRFNTQHYNSLVFRDHVMPTINGQTTSWSATNALVQHTDDVTCLVILELFLLAGVC